MWRATSGATPRACVEKNMPRGQKAGERFVTSPAEQTCCDGSERLMAEVSPQFAILRGKTAPGLIAEHARAKPREVAFRTKKLGLYRERSWHDYAAAVGRH